jgi:hypothetical protein
MTSIGKNFAISRFLYGCLVKWAEQANVSAAGVKATGLTVMLTAFTAAVPVLGVAVSVPEYVAGPVAVVRVSVPQVAFAPQDAG